MFQLKKIIALVLTFACVGLMGSCEASSNSDLPVFSQIEPYISEISGVNLPSSGIIALGEATHGNREFTLLKLEVFRQIVEQSDIRAFVIEGDFGGSQKVNAYIQNGEGSAAEAASEIGFVIYRTEEMVELLEWMRTFNEEKQENEQIRFYGYDMQRYDNNKEELFAYLEQSAPELHKKYSGVLSGYTDDTMFDLETAIVKNTIVELEALNIELESQKDVVIATIGGENYEMLLVYLECILENTKLRIADNYGTLRDEYMANHVQWIYEFESKYYDTKGIFITGHNGHIGKTTTTVGTEKSMGQILAEQYHNDYYAIGTEFNASKFLAPDDSGERQEFSIQNTGDSRLAVLLNQSDMDTLFFNLDVTANDEALTKYLQTKQPMSSVGEYFSKKMGASESGYTQKISPQQTYNAIIFIKSVTPSTMLSDE